LILTTGDSRYVGFTPGASAPVLICAREVSSLAMHYYRAPALEESYDLGPKEIPPEIGRGVRFSYAVRSF